MKRPAECVDRRRNRHPHHAPGPGVKASTNHPHATTHGQRRQARTLVYGLAVSTATLVSGATDAVGVALSTSALTVAAAAPL